MQKGSCFLTIVQTKGEAAKIQQEMKFMKRFGRTKLRFWTVLFGCVVLFLCIIVLNRAFRDSAATAAWRESKLICDTSDPRSDICQLIGDVRIHGNSSKIVLVSTSQAGLFPGSITWKIKPYGKKMDPVSMENVKELTLESLNYQKQAPKCSLHHKAPAIVFSTAGFTGNYFHDFNDVLVPLFITSRPFNGEVQFLISTHKPWWVGKFQVFLKHLSKYEIINLDNENRVHCFSSMLVGLRSHKELSIDPSRSPDGLSMEEFAKFMRSSYSLKRDTTISLGDDSKKKPRLLIISRSRTRTFTNLEGIVEMAEGLGYEVVVGEGEMAISQFAGIVNSCDVMMGVHGAGLTNLVFLPTKAVLIQIVPYGEMEFIKNCFAQASLDMKIRYLEYKIMEHESSLQEQYPHDHPVLRDPHSIAQQGWNAFGSVYLDKQNIKLDVGRFKYTLLQALQLLHE